MTYNFKILNYGRSTSIDQITNTRLLNNQLFTTFTVESYMIHIQVNTWAADHCPCRICKKYVGSVRIIYVFPQVFNFIY